MFTALHEVRLDTVPIGCRLSLSVTVSDVRPGAERALAALDLGWAQRLDHLATLVEAPHR